MRLKAALTQKKKPDSLSIRATQICIVPTNLSEVSESTTVCMIMWLHTHLKPSKIGMSSAQWSVAHNCQQQIHILILYRRHQVSCDKNLKERVH